MPDKWEYPWYAAWDLAFHTTSLALVDFDFAKDQLLLMLRNLYFHPNGQIPAYEELAVKFFEHFIWIAASLDHVGDNEDELWDEQDGFFYDLLRLPDGRCQRLKVRSMVGLLQAAVDGQGGRAVDGADVVEAEEAALEEVVALGVLAVHPPREVEEQLVEDALEELVVLVAGDLPHPQRRPGVHRRVHVRERPLVRRQLAVRVHVPLAAQQDQLGFRKFSIDVGQRDAVERQIPGRVPGVLPRVWHRDHVRVREVRPFRVAAAPAFARRRR